MADPKHFLNEDLSRLTSLRAAVGTTALEADDIAILQELLDERSAALRQEWLVARVNEAVETLFPRYDSRCPEASKPIRWPDKAWWWNGASVSDWHEESNGDVIATVSSYVGRGTTDELEGFRIHKAWLDAEDLKACLHAACVEEGNRRNAEMRTAELARAQREAAAAAAKLRQLQGGHHG